MKYYVLLFSKQNSTKFTQHIVFLYCMFLFLSGLSAGTITVTNTNDSGAGSLRQAIADANSGDEIQFSVTGTITLTSDEYSIDKNLTITGPGADQLVIDGDNSFRIFNISSGNVTITGLKIQNGNGSEDYGGAIFNESDGNFTLHNCCFSNNSSDYDGGAVYIVDATTVSISNTTFSGNSATGSYGGAVSIEIPSATGTFTNCTFYNNSSDSPGGAIDILDGTIEIINCTITNNTCEDDDVGGINLSGGTLNIKNSIVTDNMGYSNNYDVYNDEGTVNSNGYNVVNEFDNCTFSSTGDVTGSSPAWDSFGNNGGTIPTYALATEDNIARDKIPSTNSYNGAPFYDARNYIRANNYDIGAYEYDGTNTIAVMFTDGSGFTPSVTPGNNNQVVGRFQLTGALSGASLTAASIKLNGTRSGLSNLKLWSSTDASFDAGSDTQLGSTVSSDPCTGNSVSFSGFSSSISTSGTYYFLTGDVTSGATGAVQGVIVQNSSLTLSGGTLLGTITNALLSGSDVTLPVELSSFTATHGEGMVILRWITESEVNNEVFILEKSMDGITFIYLDEIQAKGAPAVRTVYEYTDRRISPGVTCYYRLSMREKNGQISHLSTISTTQNVTVRQYELYANYPNPFNPGTRIRFAVPAISTGERNINLSIYDITGRLIHTLYDGPVSEGIHEIKWNGHNSHGIQQTSGTYFVMMRAVDFVQYRKILLMK